MAVDHILSWSNPGDTVFDPFMGSETLLIAARQNGRRAIGINLSEEYCDLARRRIEAVAPGVPAQPANDSGARKAAKAA